MKKPMFIAILAIFVIFVIPVINMGTLTVTKVNAETLDVPDLKEGDVSLVLDSLLDNLTISIAAPATAALASYSDSNSQTQTIYEIGKVIVRSSTFPYDIRNFDNSIYSDNIPTLHFAQPEFAKAYFTAARYSGTYDLAKILNPTFQSNIRMKVNAPEYLASIASLQGTNDTAEASGFIDEFTESYSLNSLTATTETISNASQLLDYTPVEPLYQDYANFTESNENGADFLGDLDIKDKQRKKNIVSGFDNVEESVFEILKAELAANFSTAGDQITVDRVTILEYDLDNANQTAYMKENFVTRVRAVVNNELINAETANVVKIFGFKVLSYKGVMKVNAGFFDSIGGLFGKAINIGKTIVSAPFRAVSSVAGSVAKIVTAPIKAVTSTISKGFDFGKSIIHKALSAPVTLVKTIGGIATNIVGKAASVVTPLVGAAGKLATKAVTGVLGIGKGIGNFIMLLLFGGILMAIIGLVVYFRFFRGGGTSPA